MDRMDAMVTLGIDIVHIPSFAEQLRRPGSRFTDVFHPTELRQAHTLTDTMRAEHLAGLWAAKEAFIKAWSNSRYGHPPIIVPEQVVWSDIIVESDIYGRTRIRVGGAIAAASGLHYAPVSISHDVDYATAVCQLDTT